MSVVKFNMKGRRTGQVFRHRVALPAGGYRFADVQVAFSIGQQRRVNGTEAVRRGAYFEGDLTTVELTQGRIAVLPQMSVEPNVSFNWVDTPYGAFQTNLAVMRVNYAFSPRIFFSGLVQYNSSSNSFGSNLRLRWEYSPGSELFVVYTDDLRPDLGWDLRNRGLVVNFNKLFRFREGNEEGNLVSTMTALVPLSTGLIGGRIEATLSPITKALTQMAGFLTYR